MISEIKAMWLVVMFDLPVKSKEERREYTKFRNSLLADGFLQLQFSVYARFCASRENTRRYTGNIRAIIPPEGRVRILMITDKQFGEMISLFGKSDQKVEDAPEQLLLF